MNSSQKKYKLLSVLVLGGAALAGSAHAQQTPPEVCHIELSVRKRLDPEQVYRTVCLDGLAQKELTEALTKAKQEVENCLTPFCGCWLG